MIALSFFGKLFLKGRFRGSGSCLSRRLKRFFSGRRSWVNLPLFFELEGRGVMRSIFYDESYGKILSGLFFPSPFDNSFARVVREYIYIYIHTRRPSFLIDNFKKLGIINTPRARKLFSPSKKVRGLSSFLVGKYYTVESLEKVDN